ncbi:competence/damage-inducible protein A [Evansella halocellulosilytica]|uniref:competence/damage-inducible protein A n=1 Tax=Evansella halocellulosilytica TaxID=2011013 RepID=UPI000BB92910|nr:competence/damage-inducible protein A [Evansella halocellulosilytica]
MNAEIVAVGSELLLGQIDNTNATYLSKQLNQLGINVYHHTVVGDNMERLHDVLHTAINRSDLVITTGGLGPTKDDLTKETLSKLLDRRLIYDESTEQKITRYFQEREKEMTANNRKQALVIEGSTIIANNFGLACGMFLKHEGSAIIMLPGPPKELIPMFENECIPLINERFTKTEQIQSRILRFFDIGESKLVDILDNLIEKQENPTIAPLASDGEVTLRLTVKGSNEMNNKKMLDDLQKTIVRRVGQYFYGTGDGSLRESVIAELRKKNLTLSSAESLTGGLFAAEMTSVSGASECFVGGLVTYTNKLKQEQLSVSEELLNTHGAISHECAKEMADKARIKTGSDLAVSFTGVAGPKEAEKKSPGLVYIGLSSKDETTSFELHLAGHRSVIRERSVKYGLYNLLKWLRKDS